MRAAGASREAQQSARPAPPRVVTCSCRCCLRVFCNAGKYCQAERKSILGFSRICLFSGSQNGLQFLSGRCGDRRHLLSLPGIEPRYVGRPVIVAVPT